MESIKLEAIAYARDCNDLYEQYNDGEIDDDEYYRLISEICDEIHKKESEELWREFGKELNKRTI